MMRLEWKQYGIGTWKLHKYPRQESITFQWVGKVFALASGGFMAQVDSQPQLQSSSQYQPFESKEEAMTWVEVIVRMEGVNDTT